MFSFVHAGATVIREEDLGSGGCIQGQPIGKTSGRLMGWFRELEGWDGKC